MKTIAFHVEKGGTGKTTMTGNVAFELANYLKTIMIDSDPQGNLTGWYADGSIDRDLADVLQGKAELDQAVMKLRKNLFLLPTIAYDGELKQFSETEPGAFSRGFIYLLQGLEAAGYEIAVFDLGPGISELERTVLSSVDEIIPVIAAETFSIDGLEIFERELEKLRQRRARFSVDKLIVNRINHAYSLHSEYIARLGNLNYRLFQIGQSTGISDCVVQHKSVFEFDPGNRFTTEFQRIAQEIVKDGSK